MALSSGLSLLSCYSDEEDDEIGNEIFIPDLKCDNLNVESLNIPLDSSNSTEQNSSIKRLPLPSSIVQLFSNKPDVNSVPEDNPDLHEGRIRSFPHQRGNWSTYVYVPYEPGPWFSELLLQLQECAAEAGVHSLKPVADPHISLTRTVVLLHHWIDNFHSAVKTKLRHIPQFAVQLGQPELYCNEERTRTFLGLRAVVGANNLGDTARALDDCLAEFRLPPFYQDPSFHLSVLWTVGDVRSQMEHLLPILRAEVDVYTSELSFHVTHCVCKCGNRTSTFPLATSH